MKFYLGTTNPYKVRELASILRPLGIPLEVTEPVDPEETGDTFEANARIKSTEYAKHVGRGLLVEIMKEHAGISEQEARTHLILDEVWTISEDSGLVIPALGGLPGPWSARFSDYGDIDAKKGTVSGYVESTRSRDATDLENNKRVLQLLEGIEQPRRAAMFVVSLMVSDVDGTVVFQATSRANGWIAGELRGDGGFGYDPIFVSDTSFGKTWAEIDPMRKNLISHRRKVLQEFTMWLAHQIKIPGANR